MTATLSLCSHGDAQGRRKPACSPPLRRLPRWRGIAETLTREVTEGRFAGKRLPAEDALAARFGVNRHTVRRAVAALADQGLVRVEQGRGTFVAGDCLDFLLGRRARHKFDLALETDGLYRRLIRTSERLADPAMARAFGIVTNTSIITIEVLGEAGGAPLSFEVHCFPERFAKLAVAFGAAMATGDAQTARGLVDYHRRVSRVVARMPSDVEAYHLRQAPSRPVLQIEWVNIDMRGIAFRCSTAILSGDRAELVDVGGRHSNAGPGSNSARRGRCEAS